MTNQTTEASSRGIGAVSVAAGIVATWALFFGPLWALTDIRKWIALLILTLHSVAVGPIGQGASVTLSELLGHQVIAVLLGVIAAGLLAWAVFGFFGIPGHGRIAAAAAAIMVGSWIPFSRAYAET